jgi:hypothetical protein
MARAFSSAHTLGTHMGKRFRPVLLTAAWLGSACMHAQLPTATAAAVEQRQCTPDVADKANFRLLRTATVLDASPILTHMLTGNNNSEDRVAGAKIVMRAPEGVSLDRMTRLLQCHSAQALLGQVDVSEWPDDPFWLPRTAPHAGTSALNAPSYEELAVSQ